MTLARIEVTPFAVIVGDILQNRRSGHLTILRPPLRKVLYWSHGELVMAGSEDPADSLGALLVSRGVMTAERAQQVFGGQADMQEAVARLHEDGILDLSARQSLLREWLTAQFVPLFSLDDGTTAFTDDEPLAPEKRIFVQSTAALVLEGVRSITNGLVLRRSLGDLKGEIEPSEESDYSIDELPLTEQERGIAAALTAPTTIEAFLKQFAAASGTAAKVVAAMLTIGVFAPAVQRAPAQAPSFDDTQRDLELLAALGSSDQRSLRAVAMSRQLPSLDHYQVLEVPRAATRAQILSAGELMKQRYNPTTYPAVVRATIDAISRRVEEAVDVLSDATRRASYDKMLTTHAGRGTIEQRTTKRSIAEQNFARAKQLAADADYYGAIVLLKQAVHFIPDHADAWFLLGACQERNPKWRRHAVESYQMALSHDANNIEAMISLGDLYRQEGLATRAQTCYEDVLKIAPDNPQAKSRLQQLKKR